MKTNHTDFFKSTNKICKTKEKKRKKKKSKAWSLLSIKYYVQ